MNRLVETSMIVGLTARSPGIRERAWRDGYVDGAVHNSVCGEPADAGKGTTLLLEGGPVADLMGSKSA
jgi:hypothetical protein